MQFSLRHPAVISAVVGARDAAQAAGNLARYDAEIPAALWDELEEAGFSGPLVA